MTQLIKSSSNEKLPFTWVTLVEADILFYNKNYQQFSLCFVLRNIAPPTHTTIVFTLRDQQLYTEILEGFWWHQKMNFEMGMTDVWVEMLAENNWGWLCEKE